MNITWKGEEIETPIEGCTPSIFLPDTTITQELFAYDFPFSIHN